MKVIGVINNYDVERGDKTVFPDCFLLADSSLLKDGKPFFVPPFDNDFRMYPSLVVKINRLGKYIHTRFAHRYYDSVALGLNIRAVDNLTELRNAGLPWTSAIAFDATAVMSNFISIQDIDLNEFGFTISKNDLIMCEWNVKKLFMDIDTLISQISKRMTLKIGDLIYVGFSENGFEIDIDDHISGVVNDEELLNFKIK